MKAYLEACKRVTEVVSEGVSGVAAIRRNYRGLLSLQAQVVDSPHHFGTWMKLMRAVMTLHPHSASCERLFSKFKKIFGKDRGAGLSDHDKFSLLRYSLSQWMIQNKRPL